MIDLFATATETKKTSAAKADKDQITINENTFHNSVYRLAEIVALKEALEAEEKSLADDIKLRSISEFAKLYDKSGIYPGSFNVVATGGKRLNPVTDMMETLKEATYMFLPTDKYIMLNEDSYNFLSETYGPEIVEKTTAYMMDSALVEKYGPAISKAIVASTEIPDDVKGKLITRKTSFSVKKGTIKSLKTFKASVSELVANILPVFQRKNIRIVE